MVEFYKGALNRGDYTGNGRLHSVHETAGKFDPGPSPTDKPMPRVHAPVPTVHCPPISFPRGGMNGNPESENSSDYRFTRLRGYGR
jgi:hypothetical protein